jgi:hypothetical protein
MREHVERQMLAAMPSGTLKAGPYAWRLYVLETRRVDRDWFMRLAAVGQRTHTIDVRVRADRCHSVTAERVLAAIRDWLLSGDVREDVFLELAGISEQAC